MNNITCHGFDITAPLTPYEAKLIKPSREPRFTMDYVSGDGDDFNQRPQIEWHCLVCYDLDERAVEVYAVEVMDVIWRKRPCFDDCGVSLFGHLSKDDREHEERRIRKLIEADERWKQEALDAAETRERTGSDY